jgi:hypothetical protein
MVQTYKSIFSNMTIVEWKDDLYYDQERQI